MSKKAPSPFVYERTYDLTNYDESILKKYTLERAIYKYVGSSNKYNLTARNSSLKYDVLNDTKFVNKKLKEFLNNLISFYKEELKIELEKIYDDIFYKNSKLLEYCKTLEEARQKEFDLINKYHVRSSFYTVDMKKMIILSTKDGGLKEIIKGDSISIEGKSKDKLIIGDLTTITFNFDLKNGTVNFKINDIIEKDKEKNTQSLVAESVSEKK